MGMLLPDNRAYLYQWANKTIEADVNCKSFKVKLKQFMKNTEIEYELGDFIDELEEELLQDQKAASSDKNSE